MPRPTGSHTLKAEWVAGTGLVVKDRQGNKLEVSYGATADLGTCYAHVQGLGFIGGWTTGRQRPPKMQFRRLVESINCGILYPDTDSLPRAPFIGHGRQP